MKKLIASAFILSAAFAFAESVTGVTAKQRWPWNNLVDIDFTLSNPAKQGEVYHIEIEAESQSASGVKYSAKTLVTEPIVGAGTHRMTWDFGTDYPNVKIVDMVFTVSATPFDGSQPVYMVVDLSGGQTATSYPIRYTTTAPVHTVGQNDPCKTTELWLKRVRAGTFTAGNGTGTTSNYYYPEHTCVLTNDFYLGVFSLTKAQYLNVADLGQYDYFTNQACYATRPCDDIVSPRGPETKASENPASDSWLGKLNTRTGLVFDLPTEWQWEYVARAGGGTYDTAQIRNSTNVSASDPDQNWTEEHGTSYVDRYPANAWGFYGMLGNVWEFCREVYAGAGGVGFVTPGATLIEPLPNPDSTARNRAAMGGSWKDNGSVSQPYYHINSTSSSEWKLGTCNKYGARIILVVK